MEIDITAMIDVVFLLIIFFMTTAQFVRLTRAEVELPVESGQEEQRAEPGLVVNVTADGRYIVEQREVPFQRLVAMIDAEVARARGDVEQIDLRVRADRRAPAEAINRLAERLTRVGARRWRLATETPGPGSGGAS
jgi:biopolymer transport protein ExbD